MCGGSKHNDDEQSKVGLEGSDCNGVHPEIEIARVDDDGPTHLEIEIA